MLRFSQLVGWLTSSNRRQNLRLQRSVCLQICLQGCRCSPQSLIDGLTLSNFPRVFVSVTVTPSLLFAFHFPIHDFERHQVATNRHCHLEAYFTCLVDRTVQGAEHCEVDCNFRLERRRVCFRFGERSRCFAL